jgi:hypothetical protein
MESFGKHFDMEAIRQSSAGFLITPEMDFRKETIYFIIIDRFHHLIPFLVNYVIH